MAVCIIDFTIYQINFKLLIERSKGNNETKDKDKIAI